MYEALILFTMVHPTISQHIHIRASIAAMYSYAMRCDIGIVNELLTSVDDGLSTAEGVRMLLLPERDFWREFRMSQTTFMSILNLVESNEWFCDLSVGRQQAPAMLQLAVILWRLTHNGNGALVPVVAWTFGCSGQYVSPAVNRSIHCQEPTRWARAQQAANGL